MSDQNQTDEKKGGGGVETALAVATILEIGMRAYGLYAKYNDPNFVPPTKEAVQAHMDRVRALDDLPETVDEPLVDAVMGKFQEWADSFKK